ncbi:hypothetical protein [Streptomyces sp. NRRL S-337]|uniref:hypothetical protein n=1 Tax=Streptomyces sp. NRRL S-337 TaxID=1463900 RepID=UPI003B63B3C2
MISGTLGLALAVLVTAASVHDSAGGKQRSRPAVSPAHANTATAAAANAHPGSAGPDITACPAADSTTQTAARTYRSAR